LFDTRRDGQFGGTGSAFDWSVLSARSELSSAFVAGGIGADNAAAAARLGAYGLDIGSRIEAAPGRKDPAKVEALFAALRPAARCRR
jgi:indole-3-glycerol phosphate synthase/phosphoribosylanthranilate isomerase